MQVDKLDEFITRPEYQPPPTRTAKQKDAENIQTTTVEQVKKIWQFTGSPILRLQKNLQQSQSSDQDHAKQIREIKCHFQHLCKDKNVWKRFVEYSFYTTMAGNRGVK